MLPGGDANERATSGARTWRGRHGRVGRGRCSMASSRRTLMSSRRAHHQASQTPESPLLVPPRADGTASGGRTCIQLCVLIAPKGDRCRFFTLSPSLSRSKSGTSAPFASNQRSGVGVCRCYGGNRKPAVYTTTLLPLRTLSVRWPTLVVALSVTDYHVTVQDLSCSLWREPSVLLSDCTDWNIPAQAVR